MIFVGFRVAWPAKVSKIIGRVIKNEGSWDTPGLPGLPALLNLPALPPKVVAASAARSLPSHAPVARMTVVN